MPPKIIKSPSDVTAELVAEINQISPTFLVEYLYEINSAISSAKSHDPKTITAKEMKDKIEKSPTKPSIGDFVDDFKHLLNLPPFSELYASKDEQKRLEQFIAHITLRYSSAGESTESVRNFFINIYDLFIRSPNIDPDIFLNQFPPAIDDLACLGGIGGRISMLRPPVSDLGNFLIEENLALSMEIYLALKDNVILGNQVHLIALIQYELSLITEEKARLTDTYYLNPRPSLNLSKLSQYLASHPSNLQERLVKRIKETFDNKESYEQEIQTRIITFLETKFPIKSDDEEHSQQRTKILDFFKERDQEKFAYHGIDFYQEIQRLAKEIIEKMFPFVGPDEDGLMQGGDESTTEPPTYKMGVSYEKLAQADIMLRIEGMQKTIRELKAKHPARIIKKSKAVDAKFFYSDASLKELSKDLSQTADRERTIAALNIVSALSQTGLGSAFFHVFKEKIYNAVLKIPAGFLGIYEHKRKSYLDKREIFFSYLDQTILSSRVIEALKSNKNIKLKNFLISNSRYILFTLANSSLEGITTHLDSIKKDDTKAILDQLTLESDKSYGLYTFNDLCSSIEQRPDFSEILKIFIEKKILTPRFTSAFLDSALKSKSENIDILLQIAADRKILELRDRLEDLGSNGFDPVEFKKIFHICLNNAINSQNIHAIIRLLPLGMDLEAVDVVGSTSLHYAALQSSFEVFEIICSQTFAGKNPQQQKQLLELKDHTGLTALHLACEADNLEAIQRLLTQGADIDCLDHEGRTPLNYIAEKGKPLRIAQFLISRGASLETIDKYQTGILHHAVIGKNIALIQIILDSFFANKTPEQRIEAINRGPGPINGYTPIHIAASAGSLEIMDFLVQHGANINKISAKGYTVVHVAAISNQPKILQVLARRGFALNELDLEKYNPLHLAANNNSPQAIEALLELGMDINYKTPSGSHYTPLALAVYFGNYNAIALLLEKGARLTDIDIDQSNIFHIAARTNHTEILKLLFEKISEEETKQLFDAKNKKGLTPLFCAIESGENLEVAQKLIDRGADIHTVTGRNYTLLTTAIFSEKLEVVRFILEKFFVQKSAEEKQQIIYRNDFNGYNSLHYAARNRRDTNILNELLAYGCDINSKTSHGSTAIHIAAQGDSVQTIKFLESHGAKIDAVDDNGNSALHHAAFKNSTEALDTLLDFGLNKDGVNQEGETPLHMAIKRQYVEAMRLLLIRHAKIDIANQNGKTTTDLAEESQMKEEFEQALKDAVGLGRPQAQALVGSEELNISSTRA